MVGDGRRQDRLATWALIQGFGERECEPLSKGRYRIGDMALGSQRCVRCIPTERRGFSRCVGPKGESPLVRG